MLAMFLAAAATAQSPAPHETDAAITIAQAMAPREQLRGLILATLSRATTAAMIEGKLGREATSKLFATETAGAVDRHGDEWADLLAAAYRDTLTPVELATAQAAFRSGDRTAMAPLMQRVGPVMQERATPLLNKAVTEVLAAAYEKMGKETAR
ncbi:hypothetical protein ASG67_09325 [Sphingomonas sp. Leaf339]|nr:hypothetical protein ASG67_09325 [Sphingomonas sp. Leaf339]